MGPTAGIAARTSSPSRHRGRTNSRATGSPGPSVPPGGQTTAISSVTMTATESMSMKVLSSGFTNSL